MMWLIRRLLIVWLTLAVICVGALLVGRRNAGLPVLRTLGFDVCEGKPCYKGIRPGMEWASAQRQLASNRSGNSGTPGTAASVTVNASDVASSNVPIDDVQLYSEGSTMVKAIAVEGLTEQGLPITIGAIIAQYGTPCRLDWYGNDYGPNRVFINYPDLLVFATIAIQPVDNPADLRLQPNTPVQELWITDDGDGRSCSTPVSGTSGPWRGFISVDGYLTRLNGNQ